ncbi:para-nitrobenzyl esterase-like isoform X1 [Mya arenaria]|uniref:para-nitrobenzyl esterase-like isoform X1 n=1 Tax=Mya arenaria TaxID=6604 RepID=UPI0022E51D26|nr:para-nitrobenzyl esterase-like isoform X1 [Mya arenaria]
MENMVTTRRLLFLIVHVYFSLNSGDYVTAENVTVTTECGDVNGFTKDGAYSFRGIPYAMPPVGKRRWQPPESLRPKTGNCWNGTYPAFKYGSTCFQISPYDKKTLIGSEDCLYLNVLTPTLDMNASKPVMVWIHGGSLQFSSGSWPLYSPTERLAAETDIVYVGFNYRLHAFGFMALQVLADQSPLNVSGNYGFMDMITVLEWVQTNIRNFGGDPNQVTVFGQSSGGTAIFALLASPLCQGLFHRAWLLSASAILNKTVNDAYRDNEVFLTRTGCGSDVRCLYGLSAAKVTQAVPWNVFPYWAMEDQGDLPTRNHFDGAIAVVDGVVIPEAPFLAWSKGNMVDVPLLIGSCANEIDYNPVERTMNTWTWDQYVRHVNAKMGTFGNLTLETALRLYPVNRSTPEFQLTSMASDIASNCPNDVLAQYASSTFKSPVYRYVVTSTPSVPVHAVGIPFPASYSFHMWDIFAFFGLIQDYIKEPTLRDIQWQRNVQKEVISFVRTGKPTSEWGTYPDVTALLSDVTELAKAYNPAQCEFLMKGGFFSHAWIN